MKKETIFRHEINESIAADAAMNCLKNRNNHNQLNETTDFDARFEFRKDLRELASPVAKKAYMIIRKQYGDGMWRQLYMDDCDERGLIDMLNMYAEDGLKPQQIVNKMLGVREDEETVDYAQLADDVCASYRGTLSKLDLKDSINYIIKMVAKKIGKTVDTLSPQELTAIQKAAKHSVWYVSEQEEDTFNAYYSQDEPDYENDHHGIWLIINLMRKQGMLRAQGIEGRDDVDDGHAIDAAYDLIEQKLDEEGMWIGDDDAEAERFVSFFGEEIAEEAMKSALHNQKVNDIEGSREEYYSQDEPDYDDDSHGIRLILNMLMKRGDITKSDIPKVQKQIKSMLDAEGMWIGDDESEAERFIEMYWDNQEQEEMEVTDAKHTLTQLAADLLHYEDGDLDELYYAISDIINSEGYSPQPDEYEMWIEEHVNEIEDLIM